MVSKRICTPHEHTIDICSWGYVQTTFSCFDSKGAMQLRKANLHSFGIGYGVTANIAASQAQCAAARGSIPRIRNLLSFSRFFPPSVVLYASLRRLSHIAGQSIQHIVASHSSDIDQQANLRLIASYNQVVVHTHCVPNVLEIPL